MHERKRYWFQSAVAWGWDLPLTWQGWCTYALAVASIIAAFILHPLGSTAFVVHPLVTVGLLLLLVWWKGEPRWELPRRRDIGRQDAD